MADEKQTQTWRNWIGKEIRDKVGKGKLEILNCNINQIINNANS